MWKTLILTLTQEKLHNLQNRRTSYVIRDDDTFSHEIIINRVAQNKNWTHFAVGFPAISLTIRKPMLGIRLESI